MRTYTSERRLLSLFENFGESMKNYGRDLNDQYLAGPWQRGDTVQQIGGPVMAGASVLLEGPDRLWAAALGQELEAPAGIAGRMRRDAGELLKDVVTLHPLRALGDAWRLATSDWILDGGDLAIGARLQGSRSAYEHALAA